MTSIAKQIRAARVLIDWSQEDLAKESGVGITSIRKFENGADIRPLLVKTLQETLEKKGVEFIITDHSFGVAVKSSSN